MSFCDLPYAAQVLSKCKNEAKERKHKFTPDPRLQNWEKWMKNRKETNVNMEKRLDRHAEQLLFNYSEDLRTINEEKAVFENTNIVHPHDHYRGNPAFWKLPETLRKRPCQPNYFSVMTKEQKCEIPSMEYIGVPTEIRYEKDTVTTGYRNPKDTWDRSAYRQQRTKDLSVEIQNIEPYKPNLSELFIKGVGIKAIPSTIEESSGENISGEEKENISDSIHEEEDFLMVDNCKLCARTTDNLNVYLNFEYDLGSRELLTKTIEIENGTPYALRYQLHQRKKFFLFRDIAQEMEDQVFFYDKRELIILPHVKIELPISFKTEFPCTYKMQLEIHTRPKLWDYYFLINLVGVSTCHDLPDKSEQIKKYIDSKAHESIVKDTIYDILNDVPAVEDSPAIFYIYDKATIFEAANQHFTPITQRPKYIYDKEVVEELEHFYSQVRLPNSAPTWNFNIEELRAITKQRQELDYQNRYIDELLVVKTDEEEKKSRSRSLIKVGSKTFKSQELKPAENSERSLKMSKSSKSQVYLEENKKILGKNLVSELENILLKLEQPSVWINKSKNLHEFCYAVLCTAFDAIMIDVCQLEVDLDISRNDKYPSQYTYDFESFDDRNKERHDDLSGQTPRIQEDFIKESLPAAECLKDIPFDQCDVRYTKYYGIVEEPYQQAKEKKKGKKGRPPKKEKKGKKGKDKEPEPIKKINEEPPDINLHENMKFKISEEPSTETNVSFNESSSSDDEGCSELPSGLLQNEYKRSLYDIFYRNLLEATLKFSDMIELRKSGENKLANISRMLVEVTARDPPVEVKVLDLKQALRFAMELPSKYQAQYAEVKERPEVEPPKFEEPVHSKKEGSEWSILRPLKEPEESQKPISYPETNVYLKKRVGKRIVKDVGTIMSNAGIHPGWMDFKDIGVQIISHTEARPEKEVFVCGIIDGVVNAICREEAAAEGGYEEEEEEEGSTSSNEVFYDEDVDDITNGMPRQTDN